MKNGARATLVLALALAVGLGAYLTVRHHQAGRMSAQSSPVQTPTENENAGATPELDWLRQELKLTSEQFDKVSALHTAYRPRCMEMCRRMAEAEQKVAELSQKSRQMTPELTAAIFDHARTRADCQQAMATHLYETAAVMDDQQGARYLEMMLPYALDDAAEASAGKPPGHH